MPRPLALLLALALGALSAFAVACGEEREGLIGANRASELRDLLDRIDRNTARGGCTAVEENLAALRREVEALPRSVDVQLRRRLREGLENLEQQAPDECENIETETEPETTPETVETEPPVTQEPETTPAETEPPETQPTETEPPQTQPPETEPPATEPPETQPANPGGEEAPQG